jgi:ADP-ribose pyrophosphatase YjhB (NUDIX family)
MYKVYVNDRLVKFLPAKDSINGAEMVFRLRGDESVDDLMQLIGSFEQNALLPELYLQSADIDRTWKTFTSGYQIMEAAGGIVVNHEHSLLMIFRNGKWDLPKGKIEEGEEPDTAAIREVFEECGVGMLNLSKQVSTTFHTYPYKDIKVLKKTYWFLMDSKDTNRPVPQLEEGITDVRWMTKGMVKEAMMNTYASIADLLKEQVLDAPNRFLG